MLGAEHLGLDLPFCRLEAGITVWTFIERALCVREFASVQKHSGLAEMRFDTFGVERKNAIVIAHCIFGAARFLENAGAPKQQVRIVGMHADLGIEAFDLLGIWGMTERTRRRSQRDECQSERGEGANDRAE